MQDILIVVSTFNRRDLTGICLDSMKRCKSQFSDVVILDDASGDYGPDWLGKWGWPVERRENSVGVGGAAEARYRRFLASPEQYRYVCVVDNDLIFGARFDLRMREVWKEAQQIEANTTTLVSGYRSKLYEPKKQTPGWIEVDHACGCCQFADRATAEALVTQMQPGWDSMWDWTLDKFLTRRIEPYRSIVQHLGIHGTGVHGVSEDVAVDFVGENRW